MVLVPDGCAGRGDRAQHPVLHHHAPDGHCEMVLHNVRVPAGHLLGDWGAGFAMAQARLGPGRVHHCMRTIGQCELALLPGASARWSARLWQAAVRQANVQEWMAESRIEIDQARLLVLHAAWLLDQGARADARQVRGVSPPSRWWPRACSSAWWTAPCRSLAPWACRPTRRWPPCGPGAAPCA
jgi:acyl-CoA dehydrogenase